MTSRTGNRARVAPLVFPEPRSAGLVAKFFRGLGDPTRVRIIQLLMDEAGGELSVGQLVEQLGELQGRVSSHLACLRWCGFVAAGREGRRVYYRLADPQVAELLRLAQGFLAENADAVALCQVIDGGSQCLGQIEEEA